MSRQTWIGAVVGSLAAAPAAVAQCEWSTFPGPYDPAPLFRVTDVESTGMNEAFATGWRLGAGSFLMSWDGAAWSGHEAPDVAALPGPFPPSGPNLQLDGVAVTANGEVWAMGGASSPQPSLQVGWPIVARWTGEGWADVQQIDLGTIGVPPNYGRGGVIERASVSPDGDIWAIGTANTNPDSPGVANILTIRYHDGAWTETAFPIGYTRVNVVGDVIAFSADDAWLVGYGDSTGPFYPILAHWDGASWTEVPTPVTAQAQTIFKSITGSSSSDLWIGGEEPGGTLLLHYNGSSFTEAASLTPDTARVHQLEYVNDTDIWAWCASDGAFRYDGVAWSAATIPAPVDTNSRGYFEFARVPGVSAMWAVGSYTTAEGSRALLQRYACDDGSGPDLDGDGVVGPADLAALLASWGPCPGCPADLNGDGVVGAADLAALLAAWG